TTRGASAPAESPCHGWGRQREKVIRGRLYSRAKPLREEVLHLLQQRLVGRRLFAVEDRELFEERALFGAQRCRDANGCVPAGTRSESEPSMVSVFTSPPSAAWVMLMPCSEWMS